MKHVNVNADQMQVFVIISKGGIRINANVNGTKLVNKGV